MEAKDILTLPQETINEIFFKEEARRLAEVFTNTVDPDPMHCLREQLQSTKMILARLTLPWDRIIPILFRSFMVYMKQTQELATNPKSYQYATQLMDCMSFLSQQGGQINHMVSYFDYQIKELDKQLAERAEAEK